MDHLRTQNSPSQDAKGDWQAPSLRISAIEAACAQAARTVTALHMRVDGGGAVHGNGCATVATCVSLSSSPVRHGCAPFQTALRVRACAVGDQQQRMLDTPASIGPRGMRPASSGVCTACSACSSCSSCCLRTNHDHNFSPIQRAAQHGHAADGIRVVSEPPSCTHARDTLHSQGEPPTTERLRIEPCRAARAITTQEYSTGSIVAGRRLRSRCFLKHRTRSALKLCCHHAACLVGGRAGIAHRPSALHRHEQLSHPVRHSAAVPARRRGRASQGRARLVHHPSAHRGKRAANRAVSSSAR